MYAYIAETIMNIYLARLHYWFMSIVSSILNSTSTTTCSATVHEADRRVAVWNNYREMTHLFGTAAPFLCLCFVLLPSLCRQETTLSFVEFFFSSSIVTCCATMIGIKQLSDQYYTRRYKKQSQILTFRANGVIWMRIVYFNLNFSNRQPLVEKRLRTSIDPESKKSHQISHLEDVLSEFFSREVERCRLRIF